MMRVWRYDEYTGPAASTASVSPRGLHLMLVEFLMRNPGPTCVMTAPPPGLAGLVGLFPNTLFHVYRLYEAEEESVSNVVHHPREFDKDAADGWSIRPESFSMVFIGEKMDRQMAMFTCARPRVGMLLITEPPDYYVEGELVYPLLCSKDSHLCALIASPGPGGTFKAYHYDASKYAQGMREFQASRQGTGYDAAMESMILSMYAETQCSDPGATSLLCEIVRMGLPPLGESELVF